MCFPECLVWFRGLSKHLINKLYDCFKAEKMSPYHCSHGSIRSCCSLSYIEKKRSSKFYFFQNSLPSTDFSKWILQFKTKDVANKVLVTEPAHLLQTRYKEQQESLKNQYNCQMQQKGQATTTSLLSHSDPSPTTKTRERLTFTQHLTLHFTTPSTKVV